MFFGTINFDEVFSLVSQYEDKNIDFSWGDYNLITLISIFLFIGAMGKSALLLHTWLPRCNGSNSCVSFNSCSYDGDSWCFFSREMFTYI